MKLKNNKGFTLIELIVVMAVIGILVLLAAPRFLGYTDKTKETLIKNNIRILENAAELYVIDNDTYPIDINKTYTGTDLKDLSVINVKGNVTLEPSTTYYGLDYNKLTSYVKTIEDKDNYIIDTRQGNVYYLKEFKINVPQEPEVQYSPDEWFYIENGSLLAFSDIYNSLETKPTDIVIPEGIKSIGLNAFRNNQLTSVIFPSSLMYINEGAFSMNKLKSVIIPNGVILIGREAFYGNQLTEVTIPKSVQNIESYVFASNSSGLVINMEAENDTEMFLGNDWAVLATVIWNVQ